METVTLTGGQQAQIYGTFAAAGDYVATMFGATYTAWLALQPDQQKQTLIAATRYLDAQAWNADTAGSFAVRDAIEAFPQAAYELAVLVADDDSIIAAADQSSNVRAVGAGSARVEFFNRTSTRDGSAPVLPATLMRLVGQYLASTAATSAAGGYAVTGSDCPAFGDCAELKRREPF